MRSYICEDCKGHCDAGELIGGKCPECREKERHREAMQDRKVKLSNAPFEQMTLDLGGYAQMKSVKLRIRNLFGIKEFDAEGNSMELSGQNGVGKSSVLDAIKYALTNKSERKYIVRNGETEGEVFIETDTGLSIHRKARRAQTDYKSIKQNGFEVPGPEAFLKDIFTQLQLNPVEFMNMTEKQQNTIILDMIEYPWDLNKIREWFGEIPSWVNYDQNILCVLNDIQSEKGDYYRNRRDIDRDIRNKKAFVEDIAASIPVGYEIEKWENTSAGEIYKTIERIQRTNQNIQKANTLKANRDAKVRKFEADKEIESAALSTEISNRSNQIDKDILKFQEQIKALQMEKESLADKKKDKLSVIENKFIAAVAQYDAEVEAYSDYFGMEHQDVQPFIEEANNIEVMRSHINEYRRMQTLQEEIEELLHQSRELTEKIEKARNLPGEILSSCVIPIDGLTVEDGTPLINGLPVSNLSDGQKMDLCIDVAIQNPKGLQMILIDGVEKLSTPLRDKLYQKCREKGLQFIATRTTDEEELTVNIL